MNVSWGLERQVQEGGPGKVNMTWPGQRDGAKKSRQTDNPGTQRKNEKDNVMVNNYLGKAVENQSTTV